jgi:hypothetical protein
MIGIWARTAVLTLIASETGKFQAMVREAAELSAGLAEPVEVKHAPRAHVALPASVILVAVEVPGVVVAVGEGT